jgi:hypothetical protein
MRKIGGFICASAALALYFLLARPVAAQQRDTSFSSLQERGRAVMGVDQYASRHRFDDLPNGGRIELQTSPADTSSVSTIRRHLAGISKAFARGDFSDPMLVHAGEVPGTATMKAKREMIQYRFGELPGGGEVRILTRDPGALEAIHDFLAFQRQEHRAEGRHAH